MRKLVYFFIIVLVMGVLGFSVSACSSKRPKTVDSTNIDTLAKDTTGEDSSEQLIASTPMPKAADELFDDFIFNFAATRKTQLKRIVFPLKVYRNGKIAGKIEPVHWKLDHFFLRQDYYTLIFDNPKQMDLPKDTTIRHVIIEKIYFRKRMVKQYLFNRIRGKWMLTSINFAHLYKNTNASFLKFYQVFAADSAFQNQHIHNPVRFVGPDPDNDFSTMTGEIIPEQWPAFAPKFPQGMIYNIIYGQKYTESSRKIFVIRGIANGLEQEFTFRRIRGRWMLMKMNI
ncbi:MAG: DUF4348 domain-containing protein [Prevotella sp.]|jgi:hypothetical protein|nr:MULTISPECIES: DUF4348 domain-containing protein [unclassified Prevotella]MCH3969091.1 DUF4348 domain-containing protein [Prevotella sp.]MCH3985170.1 DUF4348 domain-containing protein [Prevotella sp.]MCH3992061.1 DUF4348 domain-containing protein [Prevotella sp.]MCH4017365.1 DUF4348 domain-containing protein [Prevotella sp.]MCH4099664.1 DUF4348 domain-containing protein [Prevotella sp.]